MQAVFSFRFLTWSTTEALNATQPLPAGGAVHSTCTSSLAAAAEASVTVLVQVSEKRVRTSPSSW